MTKCRHMNAGRCSLGLYGGRPSPGICLKVCADYDGPVRGVGDVVSKITSSVGIKPCGGCQERRMRWNSDPMGIVKDAVRAVTRRPRKQGGYFLFPAVKAKRDVINRGYLDALDKALRRAR